MGSCSSNTAVATPKVASEKSLARAPDTAGSRSPTLLAGRPQIDKQDSIQDKVLQQQKQPKKIVRVDVDTQTGFCLPEGALFVDAPESTLANIRALVRHSEEQHVCLIGCVDSHAYDAWEFSTNGGPFPAHCVKGTADWLKIPGTLPSRFRFLPMSEGHVVIGECKQGGGNRSYPPQQFSQEVRGGVGSYFEKEVYSAYANPNAKAMISELVKDLGGSGNVTFQVFGYCTGGYCVDGFAEGLRADGYEVEVVLDATAAIGGAEGMEKSRVALAGLGCKMITTQEALQV